MIDSVIKQLRDPDSNVVNVLDQFIKSSIKIINKNKELQEEILDQNVIIQISITDINFSFWLGASNGKVIYKKGINEDSTLRIEITKDLFIDMIRGESFGIDAFMKGKLKASGSLSHGLLFNKIFRLVVKYQNQNSKKNVRKSEKS